MKSCQPNISPKSRRFIEQNIRLNNNVGNNKMSFLESNITEVLNITERMSSKQRVK